MNNPNPDPGEEYPHMNTSMFGTVLPDTNRFVDACDMVSPWNVPDTIPSVYPMNGFLTDYINNFKATQGRMPTYSEYRIIMSCFPPEVVPVISTLAKGFAVADHWHCAVPSQTFCNRSFLNSAQSNPHFLTARNLTAMSLIAVQAIQSGSSIPPKQFFKGCSQEATTGNYTSIILMFFP